MRGKWGGNFLGELSVWLVKARHVQEGALGAEKDASWVVRPLPPVCAGTNRDLGYLAPNVMVKCLLRSSCGCGNILDVSVARIRQAQSPFLPRRKWF